MVGSDFTAHAARICDPQHCILKPSESGSAALIGVPDYRI